MDHNSKVDKINIFGSFSINGEGVSSSALDLDQCGGGIHKDKHEMTVDKSS